jgi:iron complex outermembrane receptor protein
VLLGLLGLAPGAARAASVDDPAQLTRLSIEELAGLKVVSVSGRPESNLEAAGAVHIVTSEDIRRTGSITIPDAMRLAPGLQASRIDADEWALAIRGFASRLSRSVLAVVDGRSIWTPLFAGVYWGAQDTLLEDVEQIEVSRGPGGAVYGANAMNGVINVTTKSARDTHGGLATLGGGNADAGGGLRWGGAVGADFNYRVFGKYAARDGTKAVTPAGYDDRWDLATGGFRLDWSRSERDNVTVLGNAYNGSSGQPATLTLFTPPYSQLVVGDAAYRGRSVLGRWRRTLSSRGELRTQVYYDHTTRHETYYGEGRDTFDIDVQHRFEWGGRNDFVWGANYRHSLGDFEGNPALRMEPGKRGDDIGGLFANDELRLAGGRLRATLGTKVEWNDYSGWNVQPSGRLAWLAGGHTFWASATRALRTSSRLEHDVIVYTSLSAAQPLFAKTTGSADFEPESVVALEGGYKLHVARLIVSASAFHNKYYDLATNEVGTPTVEPGIGAIVPVRITNGPGGSADGFEASSLVSVTKAWRVQASYSFLELDLDGPAGNGFKANSPRHQFWLASYFTPVEPLDIDLVFRAVGSIPGHNVPSFTDLDARIAYRPLSALELSLAGQNLFRPSRPEFGGGFEVERAGRLQATLRF